MAEIAAQPWERIKGESQAAYSRFLTYRNLGPQRTLDAAYAAWLPVKDGEKRRKLPGSWAKESAKYHWIKRATAWDCWQLLEQGEGLAANYFKLISKFAANSLRFVDDIAFFENAKQSIETLGKVVPAGMMNALASKLRYAVTDAAEAVGSGSGAKPKS